jgi:hypothetical protein
MKKGDSPCADCKTKVNPRWFTDNVFWNDVMGENLVKNERNDKEGGKILCPICFIKRAEKKYDCKWRLIPEFPWKKLLK